VRLLFGLIFMVLGIVGNTRETVNFPKHTVPFIALAAAFAFVSGLMIVVKKDAFSSERERLQDSLPENSGQMKDG
jgi:formate/nitrite transporter FocA (FNT family)